ncbi:arylesterase [Rhizobium sp. RU36D]|uniref:arylesterase n=1 Tax=Rhizobium sp. RU36D TaxID=1907415 RepID=UPI0009D7D5D9|nr:arylesterase [Rhizobium sp. RU36D]SMC76627.1 (3S)-malyl-CoA thioesterase [Rhizobium sp. RU36D]
MRFKPVLMRFAVGLAAFLAITIPASAQEKTVNLVGFGDSLMAGYQLAENEGLPAQLQSKLREAGVNVKIDNAGVSGDTTQGGLARIDWSVPDGTDGVILELGANDALRGIQPEQTEKNLDDIITRLKARGISVLLVGMLAPPNMGGDYAERFNPLYKRLAEKHGLLLYPFVLDGVVTQAGLQLEDGMHPNAKGVGVMAERMLPLAREFVESIQRK